MTPEEILRQLIAVRSDSGTAMENKMAEKLRELLGADPYFQAHPEHWGAWDGGDFLGRPVVWALKKGSGPKTLVLSGHYDAVGIGNYGALAPLACDPDALMAALGEQPDLDEETRRDLDSGLWLFGRGSNDMKAGVAVNLHTLLAYEPGEVNILFTAVSDEENLSAGARQAAGLYERLRREHGLDYRLGVVSEPSFRKVGSEPAQTIINGSAGKILPVVVVKGHAVHAARVMSGINAATLAADIAAAIDLNPDLVSVDKGVSTQPPAIQLLRDLKEAYDVSLPEYAGVAFNLTFLGGSNPRLLLERVQELALAGMTRGLERYETVYDTLVARGLADPAGRQRFRPTVCTVSQLEALAGKREGYDAFRRELLDTLGTEVSQGRTTLQSATMDYLRRMLAFAGAEPATAVVGIAPPYYPAANNDYLDSNIAPLLDRLIDSLAVDGIPARKVAYSQGMTDLSYMSCPDPAGAAEVMANLPLRGPVYDIDFDTVAQISIPTVMIGPGAKGVHLPGERVYLPDVNETLPRVLRHILRLL